MTDVNALAVRGIKALLGRQVVVQVITLAGGVVLARTLTPTDFGLFFIATFFVEWFALLGTFGLGAALVQRREEIGPHDLRTAFTLQQIVTTSIVLLLFAAAPWLASIYPDAPAETAWLIRALALGLYLTSWRSLSALQMERALRFAPLAVIEVIETLAYTGLAVGLALAGLGVWSLVAAVLTRGLLGAGLAYAIAPWPVRLGLDRASARKMLRYGIPFQVQGFTNQLGSWVTPLLVGVVIGPQAVGLLGWASSNARKPLMLVDSVIRVAFPHFSRLQDDRAEVERTITRYLTYLLLPAGLWFVLILVSAPSLVPVVFTDKWSPAVPALILFAGAMLFDTVAWVLGVSLNGLGRVGLVTRVTIARSVLYIGAAVGLVFSLGYNAVAIASLAASAVAVPPLLHAFGPHAAKRLLMPLAWLAIPFILSVAVGGLTLLLPLDGALRGVLAAATALVGYTIAASLARPSRSRRRVVGGKLAPTSHAGGAE